MRKKLCLLITMLIFGATITSCAGKPSKYIKVGLIPSPKKLDGTQNESGEYKAFEYQPAIYCDVGDWSNAIDSFCKYAGDLHGTKVAKADKAADIQVLKDEKITAGAYKLESGKKVKIYASDEDGVNYALSTLLQMMQKSENNALYIPAVKISDYADSSYRGMLVDLARNWHDFDYLLKYVDMCYFYKVNVLHLHFTDTQSYTLPTDLYPDLPTKDRHYTKEQISTLVEYAHVRGVELMPEIDVPGHCDSFQREYPKVFGTGGIIHQHDDSMEAMEAIFNELCKMFPYSKYIHIGGDEAAINTWVNCRECKQYAQSQGIDVTISNKDLLAEQMLANFVTRMSNVVFQNHKTPIVWEGFSKDVNDMVSKDIIVMSWENYYQTTPDLIDAGFKIINSSWVPLYIVTPDVHWPQKDVFDWNIYSWHPVHSGSPYPNGLKIDPTDQVLGGQILAWGDRIITQYKDNLEDGIKEEKKLLQERLPALAENTWNIKKQRDYDDFKKADALLKDFFS